MGAYQQISELAAELHCARLTKAEQQAAISQLHELQHQLEIDEETAIDSGDRATADTLYAEWLRIESALAA